jgi:hypothetical protein
MIYSETLLLGNFFAVSIATSLAFTPKDYQNSSCLLDTLERGKQVGLLTYSASNSENEANGENMT